MSFLEKYDAQAGQPSAQVALVSGWLRTDARPFFAELRAHRPVLATPAFTLLSRFDDVTEVLSRPEDFSVRLNAPKMDPVVGGPFMLARDNTPVNWREKGIMQAVLRPEDLPHVRAMAGEIADEALDAASPEGRIEAVNGLGRYVPIRMCGRYFGFPGPDLESMYRWSKATQSDMFKNLNNDPTVHEASVVAGQEMQAYLRQLLAEKRAALGGEPTGKQLTDALAHLLMATRAHVAESLSRAPAPPLPRLPLQIVGAARDRVIELVKNHRPPPQDVFSRLVRAYFPDEIGFDDERIMSNIAGLLIGAGETTSQAIVQVLRQILIRDKVRDAAIAAAADPDTTRFDAYVWEALRLDPINPLLFRWTERDSVVAAGTPRETTIASGTIVFALTASAMSDEALVAHPDEFQADRTDARGFHFGFGHHACLGRYVGAEMIPEVVRRVLLRPGVRLLASPDGDLDFQGGPFPERFVIKFDPAGSDEPSSRTTSAMTAFEDDVADVGRVSAGARQ